MIKELEHIMMLEGVEKVCGPTSLGKYNILFNSDFVDREEAIRIAQADEYSRYVLVLPQPQFEGMFRERSTPPPKVVKFAHLGKAYQMTKEEIEAAYRYQLRQYRLQDAERHLNNLVFGEDDVDTADEDDACRESFLKEYGRTYEEALDMLEIFVERYDDDFDCNEDENTQWENAIKNTLRGY